MESTMTDGVLEKQPDVEARILQCIYALKNALEKDAGLIIEYQSLVMFHTDPEAFRRGI